MSELGEEQRRSSLVRLEVTSDSLSVAKPCWRSKVWRAWDDCDGFTAERATECSMNRLVVGWLIETLQHTLFISKFIGRLHGETRDSTAQLQVMKSLCVLVYFRIKKRVSMPKPRPKP